MQIRLGFWLWFFVGLALSSKAQLLEPKRIQFGASLGAGGLHTFVKPSFDVHWRGTSLRVAPGLHYASVGISQRIGYFRKRRLYHERPILVNFYYHNDWLVSDLRKSTLNPRKDVQLFMFLLGLHAKLNYLNTVYCEGGIGAMAIYEQFESVNGFPIDPKWYFFPIAEFR
ncbi:MAG: hypothetical protein NZ108_07770, partial [Bacteroidia bacterium]|nr:hypothetical protein [Bacteroidia bacterium]